jgi:hypothetical protein
MNLMTKISTLLISLFLIGCMTETNLDDDFDNDLDNRFKAYDEIYEKLNEVFGEDPDFVGEITAIESGDGFFRILVEEDPEVNNPTEPGGKKIWLTINKETDVFIENENNIVQVEELQVQLGQIAGGWFIDLAESYPAQAIAQRVITVNS